MKTDAKQRSPGTAIEIINLSGDEEETNDDRYLEYKVWLTYFDFMFIHGCILS